MRAISALSRDAGMSTRVCLAVTALRIRVSMSAIGSVIFLGSQLSAFSRGRPEGRPATHDLPAAFRDAGDVPFDGQLPEAQASKRDRAHVGARTAAQMAAVAQPDLELRLLLFLRDLRCRGHMSLSARPKGRALLLPALARSLAAASRPRPTCVESPLLATYVGSGLQVRPR